MSRHTPFDYSIPFGSSWLNSSSDAKLAFSSYGTLWNNPISEVVSTGYSAEFYEELKDSVTLVQTKKEQEIGHGEGKENTTVKIKDNFSAVKVSTTLTAI